MKLLSAILSATVLMAGSAAFATPVQVKITIENLAGAGGVALSPFFVAAHDGTFDAFNSGTAAGSGTQNIAEFGNSGPQSAEFASSHPTGVSGTLTASTNAFGPGIFLPGATGTLTLMIDPAVNKFFSFGAMVVPSNDFFLGNDSPTAVRLFDDSGNFVGSSLTLTGAQIWDAGTEVNGQFGAAFIAGQDAGDHVAQNGLITSGVDFSSYLGAQTAAGYTFSSAPGSGSPVARISFEVVPEPASLAVIGIASPLLMLARRRK